MSSASPPRTPHSPVRVVSVPAAGAGLAVLTTSVTAALHGGDAVALLPAYAPVAVRRRVSAALAARPDVPWPDGAAVVCATSGSTGDPRGVVLTAANLRASVAATLAHVPGPPPAWFTCLPPATIASLMCVVRATESGTPVGGWAGAGAGRPFTVAGFCADAEAFFARIRADGGAHTPVRAVLVPTQAARLFDDPASYSTLVHFDAVVVGGGPIGADLERGARRAGVHLVRSYGLTETCGGVVHDGWPLPGVAVTTVAGELAVAGAMVAHTYTTAPLPTTDGYFRTGDRAEIDADGRVRISGRFDEVVAVKGANVDRAAVARVLIAEAGVTDCVVVAIPHPTDGHRLVAFVVGDAAAGLLRTAVADALGSVAVPEIRRVPELPMLPGGKVDQSALLAAGSLRARTHT